MYKIIFVDDEPLTIEALRSMIDWEQFHFEIIAVYDNGLDAYHGILKLRPDAVITDVRMAAMTGIDMITSIRKAGLDTEFIIISAYRNFDVAQQAIEQQALAYLLKPIGTDSLIKAVNKLETSLAAKSHLGLPVYDMDYPDSSLNPLLQNYLKRVSSRFPLCRVIVSDEPLILSNSDTLEVVPLRVRQCSYCFLVSSSSPSLKLDTERYGASRVHRDFTNFPQMVQEALISLTGGFQYAEHETASMLQRYIGEHYGSNISLADLCEVFHVSESYICGLFKKYIGCSFIDFLQSVRISQAKRLLKYTDLDVVSISYQTGFNNYSYFGRLFKRIVNTTPLSFRKSSRHSHEA